MPSAAAPAASIPSQQTLKNFIGAVKDEWRLYSDRASDYTIGAPIGFGASSIVYSATFKPSPNDAPIPCALKVVDLDRLPPHALHLLMQETQLMSLSKHPNVLRVRGTWMDGHKLYIALRLMNAGSAADVMRYGWPGGMEEDVVRCILKQALEGLNYLHINGLIHRDVKAANLLIDDDGTVLLGDLGVAAPLWQTDDGPHHRKSPINISSATGFRNPHTQPHIYTHSPHHHTHNHVHKPALGKRKSFVGTPCWMAPEVITGKQYDASADIWSFGITALELTQGRAPHSRARPSTVLTQIATAPPPKMERSGGVHEYSSAFVDMVAQCLQKDPSKRPSAQELLGSSFFKGAKKKGHLVGTVLKGLPPLAQRQEKRRVPSTMTHLTMESWDFSVRGEEGLVSPTTSVHSFHSRMPRPRSTLPREGLPELDGEDRASRRRDNATEPAHEEDAATYARRIRERHRAGSRSHSRNVSFVDLGDALEHPRAPQPQHAAIAEVDVLSSSPRPSSASTPPLKAASLAGSTAPFDTQLSSADSSSTESSEAVTPPQSVAPAPAAPLWRRLIGRSGASSDGGGGGGEREEEEGGALRRKALGGVGMLAGKGAGLVRTVSRVGTGK